MTLVDAILAVLQSPNVPDDNGEIANVVDVIHSLARSNRRIANAITPDDALAGRDATGGMVTSLTEAVMGVTAGLSEIAGAIRLLAVAIEERQGTQ